MNRNSSVGNNSVWSVPYTDLLSGQKHSFSQMLRGLTVGNASMALSENSAKSKRELCQKHHNTFPPIVPFCQWLLYICNNTTLLSCVTFSTSVFFCFSTICWPSSVTFLNFFTILLLEYMNTDKICFVCHWEHSKCNFSYFLIIWFSDL